jgi:superfamily II DNA or RNA helicase
VSLFSHATAQSDDPWAGLPKDLGLRWYQTEADDAIAETLSRARSALLVMATGTGKTQVFGARVASTGGRCLVLAHRDELVDQAQKRIEQMTGEWVEREKAEYRASESSRIVVASVQSLQRKRLTRWKPDHFSLIVIDECFPAGTLVDGVPIELVQAGDIVSSIDHATGNFVRRRVVRTFSKVAAAPLVVLRSGATTVRCTGNHPVFVRGRGYVEAESIRSGDVLCLRSDLRRDEVPLRRPPANMLGPLPLATLVGDYGAHQSPARLGTYDVEEPDAPGVGAEEDAQGPGRHGARPESSWGKRDWLDLAAIDDAWRPWRRLGVGVHRQNRPAAEQPGGLPVALQVGSGTPPTHGLHRGGWDEPRRFVEKDAGLQEDGILVWARVDSVARDEPAGTGRSRVYNLEVEGSHTYFANGVLVHNCHHATAPTYRKVLDHFSSAKVLGVTATPDRGDKTALGLVFDEVAYSFDIEDGIEQGYLVPIQGQRVYLEQIDISGVQSSMSEGGLNLGQLDEQMFKAVEGIVTKTVELQPNRQAVCFFPGVKSAEYAAQKFNAIKPGSAIMISGTTDPEERKQLVSDFKKGHYQYLANCMVATEGFDAPSTALIVLGRPTKSRALYAQMIGRGTRVLPGIVESIPGKEFAAIRRQRIAASAKPTCMVLDFVGNSGKHSLASIEDVLGGKYTEAEIKVAKKKTANGVANTLEALRQARAELAALAAKAKATVKARVEVFSPFAKLMGIDMGGLEKNLVKFGHKPMEAWQREILMKMGLKARDLQGFSKQHASKMIAESERRYKHKPRLATFGQLRQLEKFGVARPDLTFDRAHAAMNYLYEKQFRDIDAAALDRVVNYTREPGDDG